MAYLKWEEEWRVECVSYEASGYSHNVVANQLHGCQRNCREDEEIHHTDVIACFEYVCGFPVGNGAGASQMHTSYHYPPTLFAPLVLPHAMASSALSPTLPFLHALQHTGKQPHQLMKFWQIS